MDNLNITATLITLIIVVGLVSIGILVWTWFNWFFKYTSGETKEKLTKKIEVKFNSIKLAEEARHDAIIDANNKLAKEEIDKLNFALDDLQMKYKIAAEQADKYKEQLDEETEMSKIVLIDDVVTE